MSNTITISPTASGAFAICQDGKRIATLVVVPTGPSGNVSIDVQPARQSKVQAIAFGADTSGEDRLVFRTDRPNGQIRKGAMPFVCVDISPAD